MALQITLSHKSWTTTVTSASPMIQPDPTRVPMTRSGRRVELKSNPNPNQSRLSVGGKWRKGGGVVVRSSLEATSRNVEELVGKVTEVNKDSFWPIVNTSLDKPLVLDMYTQWCGPCKVMAPKFQQLAEKYLDVVFLKLDCNQENKSLAKELGIRVVPTFKILKGGKVVEEVTGAKYDNLVAAIEAARSS